MRWSDPALRWRRLLGNACAVAAVLLVGCAAEKTSTKADQNASEEVTPEVPVQVPAKVTSIGVATAKDVTLARRIAETRAIKGLARMVETDAVLFTYMAAGGDSSLEVRIGPTEVPPATTEFDKIKLSWISRATGTREPAVVATMEKLSKVQVEGQASHPDPSISLMRAESRAYRAAIAAAAGPNRSQGHLAGRLTIVTLEEKLTAEGAQVSMAAHVEIDGHRPLAEAERTRVHEEALREHRSLQEWKLAADVLARIIERSKPTAAVFSDLGQLRMEAEQPQEAADAFAKAFELDPSDLGHLKRELAAAKLIPSEDRVTAIRAKLREIEDKAKAEEKAAEAAQRKKEEAAKAKELKKKGKKPKKALKKKIKAKGKKAKSKKPAKTKSPKEKAKGKKPPKKSAPKDAASK